MGVYDRGAILALAAAALLTAGAAQAQDSEPVQLKAVGTWGNLSNWQKLEKPFWETDLPEASGGILTGEAKPKRAEERRVGKEWVRQCRSGRTWDHKTKKI